MDELEREVKKWNRQYKTREGILMKQREVFRSTCNQIQAKLDAVKPLPKRLDRFRLKDSIGPLYEAGYHDGCADAAQLIRKAIAEPE